MFLKSKLFIQILKVSLANIWSKANSICSDSQSYIKLIEYEWLTNIWSKANTICSDNQSYIKLIEKTYQYLINSE